ncbi:MAG TPA: hypothetical protein VI612_04580 [Candidatus Nanoarchaeia archaeon]|nr:hypothetical protein [Candidatus Nanoarchaeia archaeon]
MDRNDFDKDLEEYLHARKKGARFNIDQFIKDFIRKFKPKPSERVEMPEEIEVYDQKEQPKEGVFAKIFKKEEVSSEELLRTKMAAEDALEDMKEISKIALNAIKQLPDEQLRTFKQSPEFEKLKGILKKHELIK